MYNLLVLLLHIGPSSAAVLDGTKNRMNTNKIRGKFWPPLIWLYIHTRTRTGTKTQTLRHKDTRTHTQYSMTLRGHGHHVLERQDEKCHQTLSNIARKKVSICVFLDDHTYGHAKCTAWWFNTRKQWQRHSNEKKEDLVQKKVTHYFLIVTSKKRKVESKRAYIQKRICTIFFTAELPAH